MLFCQSLLYIVTFQAAMAIALPQGEIGIEDKCKHAMDIAKAADPSMLEGIEAIEAQPLMDKASSEKIYQGYCSAGKYQRCNFCDERGKLLWTRCGQEHLCRKTGHWCSWSNTSKSGRGTCS